MRRPRPDLLVPAGIVSEPPGQLVATTATFPAGSQGGRGSAATSGARPC